MSRYIKSLVIAVPLLLSIIVSFLTIHYTKDFFYIPLLVAGVALLILLLDTQFFYQDIPEHALNIKTDSQALFFLKAYIIVVSLFCIIDLWSHGLVILSREPGEYMTFTVFEHRIRHISMLVWTFFPLSFFVKEKWFRVFLRIFSVVVLVLFLDRGRLMLMFSAVALTVLFFKTSGKIRLNRFFVPAIILTAFLFFSVLGKFRSGADDSKLIEASYLKTTERVIGKDCVLPDSIPFTPLYNNANIRLKWVLAYISIPIYNLSTQEVCQHTDPYSLFRQIIPTWIKTFQNRYTVLISDKQNVGTEFMPFYLSLQEFGIILAMILVFGALYFAIRYHIKRATIFSFLIVLKLLATSVFLNFAPQFFIWTNFGFVLLFYIVDQATTSIWSRRFYSFCHKKSL